ncbi:tRNA-dihydrouridine(47) synthase [NAD(P)(+)]-like, partial [Contarinia nasturtii]|uniref:tRNA-dihydrouridine(47) synthase [NAD(P)(+)]-like n=1 Tax=Contarinia nasturtii TaxID=265458 RepID=UPI0012D48FC1
FLTLYNGPTNAKECTYEKCKYVHDIDRYFAEKPDDIGPLCPVYSTKGFCPRGVTCRFAKNHLDENRNNCKQDWYDEAQANDSVNHMSFELQTMLRKRTYNFSRAKEIAKKHFKKNSDTVEKKVSQSSCTGEPEIKDCVDAALATTESVTEKKQGYSSDYGVIKERAVEKRKVDFSNKLVLSPLTTVGNLPFRRICKEYGADITCGEMACVVPILNGISPEWALARRHKSEDIFGVQLCGNNSELITCAAQLLNENCDIDYFDLNIGCPIDLIYSQGAGSALIRRTNILESIVRSCSEVLNGTPFTVKTRTGIYSNKSVAHELVPKFEEWGAKAVTIHGRSREQRYSKNSDWEYIEKCAQQAKTIPIIGNGDVLSYEDYLEYKKIAPSVSSVMIGRGALYKPWIFQEIKEQRHIDLSASERFEMMRKYVNYGLEHWGSDTKGVENTRRFLLEWQSFLHRYIPYGILENPPQKINQRPVSYRGRDEMETLLASPNCEDWIKLSEMLLGKVPDGFNFIPKHKANSFAEAQG